MTPDDEFNRRRKSGARVTALLGRAQSLAALGRRPGAADAFDALAEVRASDGRLGDAVAVMDNGVVVHAGSMAELAENEDMQRSLLGLAL